MGQPGGSFTQRATRWQLLLHYIHLMGPRFSVLVAHIWSFIEPRKVIVRFLRKSTIQATACSGKFLVVDEYISSIRHVSIIKSQPQSR